ncbi:NAD(P)/FAD-dependent oxidoreductase [Chitinophaga sancti]|uniref:FAD-binding oxidoreductase n=1 Tax=Chitinophaga sancti TaxID=1004 RepID=A0A1K1SA37_9BACT|nr:FAD-binding oxidoreductase [Chitinophaga sancti]WQD60921.1 FAD-binding oxidoreductase [Chitinophaga sancti]WQG86951.1 FAD-binding oxidoreductase [Chitinophaga sancti]SFW80972.1 Glycine/D-amino acid oxidase [Chitinophaga sancti]
MNVDYLVVGQGIAGTMLSYSLMQAGASVLVIDEYKENSSSRVAAGVVNPVSGRRFTVAWLYDEIYPVALRTYREMEGLLGLPVYKERDLWTVLPSEQLRAAFFDRTTGLDYMRLPSSADVARYDKWLDQPFGAAIIKGGTVLLQQLLPIWREYLKKHNSLLEERYQPSQLQAKANGVTYGDIQAKAMIFCDGAQTPLNPWFNAIPFLLNKGEVLTVRVPGFETEDIVKRSISMVPVPGQNDIYWVGATFAWDYPNENPTAEKRIFLESGLRQLLKVPYEVLDHQAAIRPSGTDRRPMLGMHPEMPSLGLFNGLGTKGSSLAPAMAAQMTAHLLRNAPLAADTDIKRFFNRYKD